MDTTRFTDPVMLDQMTGNQQDVVTRKVEKDGTIVWRRKCANGCVEIKRLIVDGSGKVIGATWNYP